MISANPFPYIVLLIGMTLLSYPYFKTGKDIKVRTLDSWVITSSKVLILVCYILYIVFCVFRKISYGFGGPDAHSYQDLFYQSAEFDLTTYLLDITTFEPGYSIISWFIAVVFDDYRVALFFWHTVAFVLMIRFMRRTIGGQRFLLLVIPAFYIILFEQLNTLRMIVGLTIVINSIFAMNQNKWLKALLVIIVACSVHMSSVVFLPVLMFEIIMHNKNSFSNLKLFLMVVLAIIVSSGSVGLVAGLLTSLSKEAYLDTSSVSYGIYIPAVILIVLILSNRRILEKQSEYAETLIIALPVVFICLPLQVNFTIAYRMANLFLPIMYSLSILLLSACVKWLSSSSFAALFLIVNGYFVYRIMHFFLNGLGFMEWVPDL